MIHYLKSFAQKCLKNQVCNLQQFSYQSLWEIPVPSKSRGLKHSTRAFRLQEVKRMMVWMRENGASVDDVIVNEDSYGQLGLFASKDFSSGDVILKMPSKFVLTSHSDPQSAPLKRIYDNLPMELSDFKLGLKLLSEKYRKDSFWSPYIRTLPDKFLSTLTFSEEALDALEYSPLISERGLHDAFIEDFLRDKLPKALSEFPESENPFSGHPIDTSLIKWSTLAASSRAFGFDSENKFLIPLMDFANHSFSPTVKSEKITEGESLDYSVGLVALNDIKSGQPLEINYGNLKNDDFAYLYGFILTDNPYDRIEFGRDVSFFEEVVTEVSLTYESRGAEFAEAIINRFQLDNPYAGPMLLVHYDGIVEGALLGAIRSIFSKDYEAVNELPAEALCFWECPVEVDSMANRMALIHIFGLLKGLLRNLWSHRIFMSSLFDSEHLNEDTKLAVKIFDSKITMIETAMDALEIESGFKLDDLLSV